MIDDSDDIKVGDIKVGDKVTIFAGGDALERSCEPGVVLCLDGEWPGDPPCLNRQSAWIRFTTPDGFNLYRSADVCDLEKSE